MATPLFAARLQDAIQSGARATVTSVSGAAQGAASLLIYQCFGLVAAGYGMSGGALFIAGLGLLLCPLFAVVACRLARGSS